MTILALHGFTGCGADFVPFAELCGGHWHCPDLPGHGECALSTGATTPGAMVNFVDRQGPACADQASAPKILLGYSMGARAALLHASKFPRKWDALILISANPGIENETGRAERRSADGDLADTIERQGVDAFLEFWQNTPLIRSQKSIPADWLAVMQANRRKHEAGGLADSLRQFGQGSFPNLWPELSKLPMPVCLITGSHDSKYTEIARRMLPRINSPLSSHTVIERAAHMPHLEKAEETADATRRFIGQL